MYQLFNSRIKENASAFLKPETEPHLFAIASNAIAERGCGNDLISVLYFLRACIFDFISLSIFTKKFGENCEGKDHSVEDGTSNEYTFLIFVPSFGLVAAQSCKIQHTMIYVHIKM